MALRNTALHLICLGWIIAIGCSQSKPPSESSANVSARATVSFELGSGAVVVPVQVVSAPEERARGLMFREQLDARAGMLFVFEQQTIHPFWMKNTYIPLDMIFLDDDKTVVGIIENVPARTTESRSIDQPSRYVVEVNAGFARAHQIAVGMRVTISIPE